MPTVHNGVAKELTGFVNKGCLKVIKQEVFMKPLLSFKPVFKIKFNSDGTLDKFKVRFVVGGHRAVKGQHFDETFSPVLSIVILRMALAIFAAYPCVVTMVADVEQAYLWSKLEEEYMSRPPRACQFPPGTC